MSYPVITPAEWTPQYGADLKAAGKSAFLQIGFGSPPHEYDPNLPLNAWNMTSPGNGVVTLGVRPDDWDSTDVLANESALAIGGTTKERSQLSARYDGDYGGVVETPPGPGRVPVGVPTRVTFGLTLQPGPSNTSKWCVLYQMHEDQIVGSPPISLQLQDGSDVLQAWIGYTTPAGKATNHAIWTDPSGPLVRGQRYFLDVFMCVDPTGEHAYFVLNKNGARQFTLSKQPIGYVGQTNSFSCIGPYRAGPGGEDLFVTYDSVAFDWPENPLL